MESQNIYNKDIEQIRIDIELIKGLLMPKVDEEGELSDWAKNELKRSRNIPESEYISFDKVKKRIKNKK